MGDKCGVFRENSTEFQSNNGEKDASNTFIESGKYAGEEWMLQVLKQIMLQIVYQIDGAPIIRMMKQVFWRIGHLLNRLPPIPVRI